jgi:uncharacterized protein affecting Mg2+/Co2+ transport
MPTSEAITRRVRVHVDCRYSPERSEPARHEWFFLYTVRITNEGDETVELKNRHWIITNAHGTVLVTVDTGEHFDVEIAPFALRQEGVFH